MKCFHLQLMGHKIFFFHDFFFMDLFFFHSLSDFFSNFKCFLCIFVLQTLFLSRKLYESTKIMTQRVYIFLNCRICRIRRTLPWHPCPTPYWMPAAGLKSQRFVEQTDMGGVQGDADAVPTVRLIGDFMSYKIHWTYSLIILHALMFLVHRTAHLDLFCNK